MQQQPQTTNILNGFSYQKAALTNMAAQQQKSSQQSPQKVGSMINGLGIQGPQSSSHPSQNS
jgi:hypothetical protein